MTHDPLAGTRRVGAAAGLVAVALLVAIVAATPAVPAPDRTIAEIAATVGTHGDGLLLGAYLGGLMAIALLLFGAVTTIALRRDEQDGSAWWIVALVGISATSIGLIGDALQVAWVDSARHGVSGDPLWALYSAPHVITLFTMLPLAVFLLGTGLGARASGAFPRWTAWLALVVAGLLVIGAGSATGDELTGGPLAIPLLIGIAAFLVWTVAVSVSLWRTPRGDRATTQRGAELLA